MAALRANGLSREAEEIRISSANQADQAPLETGYQVWRSIERRIADCEGLPPQEREELVDQLIDCQKMVIERMEAMRSRSLHDLFCKLAVWRWETFGQIPDRFQMSGPERLAYSGYRDLRDLLGLAEHEKNGSNPPPCCKDSAANGVKAFSCESPPCGKAS